MITGFVDEQGGFLKFLSVIRYKGGNFSNLAPELEPEPPRSQADTLPTHASSYTDEMFEVQWL